MIDLPLSARGKGPFVLGCCIITDSPLMDRHLRKAAISNWHGHQVGRQIVYSTTTTTVKYSFPTIPSPFIPSA